MARRKEKDEERFPCFSCENAKLIWNYVEDKPDVECKRYFFRGQMMCPDECGKWKQKPNSTFYVD
jgi:hypothetical protein